MEAVARSLRAAFGTLLGARSSGNTWTQVTLPVAKGGLGLQIPADSAAAARLASLVTISDMVPELGTDPEHLRQALVRALVAYCSQRGITQMLVPAPDRHLQRELTDPILSQKAAHLFASSEPADQKRLLSVASPHALQWTMGPNPWLNLSAAEFRTRGKSTSPSGPAAKIQWTSWISQCTNNAYAQRHVRAKARYLSPGGGYPRWHAPRSASVDIRTGQAPSRRWQVPRLVRDD